GAVRGDGGVVGQVHLEPDVGDTVVEHAPPVGDLAHEVQPPPGRLVDRRHDLRSLEPGTGVDDLHPHAVRTDVDGEVDLAGGVQASVPDAVRDQLAHQQPDVLQDGGRELRGQSIERQSGCAGCP